MSAVGGRRPGASGRRGTRAAVRARVAKVEVPQPAPPAVLGTAPSASGREVAPPRLARYELVLPSGREVGVNLCGEGVPLVVIHGFGGEGILYAQTLARLVRSGFKVITIDAPGHGRSGAVPLWSGFDRYTSLVSETLDHLGVERAILVGHSMGGRVVS
ncbi:MAG: alpha/beta fold hydrolase, partial [Acidimicrobiales bacterium]|nr:alpha/beta fold hydrolase [Acidimicrobiales bacterium]